MESIEDIGDAADAIVQVNRKARRLRNKTQSSWLMHSGDIELTVLRGRATGKHHKIVAGIMHIPGSKRYRFAQLHIASQHLSWPNDVEHAFSAASYLE